METIEIQKSNLQAAYAAADESGKTLLRNLFPDADLNKDNRPVTERIKTFEDACQELGEEHPFVVAYRAVEDIDEYSGDVEAYLKLRIIVAALNEGWKPEFTEDEWRWYPWFYLYTQEELNNMEDSEKKRHRIIIISNSQTKYKVFGSAASYYAPSNASACVGSRLCLRSSELAVYCGKQFIELWADYNLIRK
jgi:hypothetical protein